MKRQLSYEDTRPTPVVRKEQYTVYCELLLALRDLSTTQDSWVGLEALCMEFACTPAALQRPVSFLASHGWIYARTDDHGYVVAVRFTARGASHKVLQ